jgi:type IV pilus assembly protein PilW
MKNKHYQIGLSLIEIMIALLIGAFLLGGVLQIFIGSKQTYRMQDNLSRLQENGRLAMDFLANDIRMAGYQGCPSLRNVTPKVIAGDPVIPALTENSLVSGAENITTNWNANACGAGNVCIANTDAINLIYSDTCGGNLTIPMDSLNADIKIPADNSCNVSANEAVLVSNCRSVDIFRAINDSTTAVTHPILNFAYGTDAELFVYRAYSYFIRESTSDSLGRSLWRLDNARVTSSSNPAELIEGIENMQILYGADTNADHTPNYYVPAETGGLNLSQVVSIRITLTARTIDGNLTTTGDGRIRRDFTSTIALRNRLP